METDARHQELLDVIDQIRADKWACPVAEVAVVLRMSKSSAHRLIQEAAEAGLVEWTRDVAGSLRTTRSSTCQINDADETVQRVDDAWLARLRERLLEALGDEEWADWVVDVARSEDRPSAAPNG